MLIGLLFGFLFFDTDHTFNGGDNGSNQTFFGSCLFSNRLSRRPVPLPGILISVTGLIVAILVPVFVPVPIPITIVPGTGLVGSFGPVSILTLSPLLILSFDGIT